MPHPSAGAVADGQVTHGARIGLSWWKWDETQRTRPHYDPDPKKDRGFTIYGKPAAEVMRKWSKQTL